MTTHAIPIVDTGIGYGAAELKKFYHRFLRRGLEFAILVHILVISVYLLSLYINKLKQEQLIKQQQISRVITLSDLEPPPSLSDEETPPPKNIESITTPAKDLSALTPEPVAKEKAEILTTKTQKELEEIKTPVSALGDTGKLTFSGPIKVEEKKIEEKIVKEEKVDEEKITYKEFEVEKPPECVNLDQVRSSIAYPEVARQAGIEGRVTVKVLVGPDGNVIKIGAVTGPDVFYDEVTSKARDLQFTPGLQNGKPVRVWVTVPFNFKLRN